MFNSLQLFRNSPKNILLLNPKYSGCKMRGSNIIIAYRGVRVLIKVRENIKKVLKF